MPHCIIKQPNGNFAIWSTIIDNFLQLDIAPSEIKNEAVEDQIDFGSFGQGMPRDELETIIEKELANIEATGYAWDWAPDWNSAMLWLETYHERDDTLEEIDKLGLPHKMKRKSSLQIEKHWHQYWRDACADRDRKIRLLRNELAKLAK